MIKFEPIPRVFDAKTFFRHLKRMLECVAVLIRARMSGRVSKSLSEKIMLAVTEVNGCRFCNYIHTRNALKAGVPEDDIQSLLNRQFDHLDPDETHALLFAQHYADTGGFPDPDMYQGLEAYYGEKKAREILAIIRTIMVGNIYGLSLDAIISRIKRKALLGSKLKDEMFIVVGIFLFIPAICIQLLANKCRCAG